MKIAMLFLVAAPLLAADLSSRPMRRYLVAASSNDGGPGKAPLRFAHDDARGVVATMRSVGGVHEAASELLLEPDTGRFLSTLREVSERMVRSRDSGYRVELMLYYSGHSDEDGLLLGASKLRYLDLRRALEKSPAEVRLAVLDACASGAALRTKGGVRRQAFHIEGADRLRGQAFLTSSRASEASQESDKLRGSVFTQSFLAGLRGAADVDSDGRVTLLEAYRYAYRETVEKTASTRVGPQHPEFDLDLSGSGDVVLADIAQAGAVLDLSGDLRGRVRIADSTGAVAAELEATPGRNLAIGLPSGTWTVAVTDSVATRVGRVELGAGTRTVFAASRLDSTVPVFVVPVAKFDSSSARRDTSRVAGAGDSLETTGTKREPTTLVPFNFGFAPPVSINSLLEGKRVKNNLSIDVFAGETAEIDGIQVSAGVAKASRMRGLQASLASFADESIQGFQTGGLYAFTRKGGEGFQSAGLMSRMDGPFRGFQSAGLATTAQGGFQGFQSAGLGVWNEGQMRGFQSAGLLAYNTGELDGFQTAGLAARSRDRIRGFQTAGIVAMGGGDIQGFQTSGLVAWNEGRLQGFQTSGVFAYNSGDLDGFQTAVASIVGGGLKGVQTGVVASAASVRGLQVSVVNISGSVAGLQAGVINIAGSVRGSQVGVVNLAGESKGVVVGVVNLARKFDALPIGLVSAGANLRPGLDVMLEESGLGSVLLRLEGDLFHSRLGGTADLSDATRSFGPVMGFGAHWSPVGNWRLDADASCRQLFQFPEQGPMREAFMSSASVSGGRKFGPVRVSAGLSYNVLVADGGEGDGFVDPVVRHEGASNRYVTLWPGAFVSMGI